jgi:two-component system chemotaxis response regulator CheY
MPPESPESPAMRLLIVDDSNLIRTFIARIVANKGYAPESGLPGLRIVGLARTGTEAVELARQTTPDIVTLDITMPEMDGLECLDRLMQIVPRARVLMVSALSDKATALSALKKGARGFLHKPFTEEDLVNALREVLA